ncbi:MAG: response regulator [Vallitaleaceae bacterium]|nr:response regulator [Vallitaleaceae bacterium]
MANSLFEPSYETLQYNFHKTPMALLIFDSNGQLINVNETYFQLLPHKSPEELLRLSLYHDFQIEDKEFNLLKEYGFAKFEVLFDTSKYLSVPLSDNLKTSYLPLQYSLYMLPNGDVQLKIAKIFSSKEATDAVVSKNHHLALELSVGNVCLWDWNLVSDQCYFSENFYSWFDFDVHFLANNGRSYIDLICEEDKERLIQYIRDSYENHKDTFYLEYRLNKTGAPPKDFKDYLWVQTSGTIVRDAEGKIITLAGVMVNISSEIESRIQLEEQKTALNKLFDNMSTGFALLEAVANEEEEIVDAILSFVNPAFETITGISSNKVLQQKISEFLPSLYQRWLSIAKRVVSLEETIHFVDSIPELQKHLDFIAYPAGNNQLAVIFSDVTQKVLMEKAMTQADKMNSIGQLAGGIAHDFNNHLQIIRGYSEILRSKSINDSSDSLNDIDMTEYLDKILLSVNHSSRLTKQLLAFTKEGHLNFKPIDFHYLLHKTKDILSYSINKNISIQLFLDARDYKVVGEENLLQNALINLCLNSRDALPNGGLIQIYTKNIIFNDVTMVGTRYLDPGTYIVCSIRDNGNGIKEEHLSHIFEPFFSTKSNKGTGMSLAAVLNTLKNHEGSIDVHSVFGEWTQFDLYLMTSQLPVVYDTIHRSEPAKSHRNFNILLVDDEPVISSVIAEYLTEQGHTVYSYTQPNEVLENVEQLRNTIDLALLDVIMPEMSGFDLLRELVQVMPNLKAVFLSGYFNAKDKIPELEEHILDYIEKPVHLKDLQLRIQKLMEG